MKLWVFSDLHIEQSDWDLPDDQPDCDVIVAAGDIHFATDAVVWLSERSRGRPVIYVPGNHEWYSYRRSFNMAGELARAKAMAAGTSVHLLQDEATVIDGVRFLGSTLWTDYALYSDQQAGMKLSQHALNDHRLIRLNDDGTRFAPTDALAMHTQSRQWLTEALHRNDGGVSATVVVTHHLPHRFSIDPKFAGHPLNVAFASDLADLIEQGRPDLWIHGHTHSSCDYVVGSTRVLCNPKGYGPSRHHSRPENPAFDDRLTVDIFAQPKPAVRVSGPINSCLGLG